MIVEIRTYRLKPGTMDEFVRVMREEALPLLTAAGLRVLAAGPSAVAEDGHEEAILIRAFESIDARESQEAAFYGSDAWRGGPREAIVSKIVDYHTIVLEVPEELAGSLRDRAA
jgi:NIPSNAP protein